MVKVKVIKKNHLSSNTKKLTTEKDMLKKRKKVVEPSKSLNIANGTFDNQEKTLSKITKTQNNKKKNISRVIKTKSSKIESLAEDSNRTVDVAIKKQAKKPKFIQSNKNQLLKNGDTLVSNTKTNVREKSKKVNIQKSDVEENVNIGLEFTKLEKKFNIKATDIENGIKGIITVASNNSKLKNELFDEEKPLFLQISSIKVPQTKGSIRTVFRIPLINSILPANADTCLIVSHAKGLTSDELEQCLDDYETLLKNKGVNGIKKIMSYREFISEYDTFELKNRLVDLYDSFLVDGRVHGKVVKKCGKIFYRKRKLPTSVSLKVTNLRSEIGNALKKSFFQMSFKGNSHVVQFGHTKMPIKALIENVYSVIEFLSNNFPGKIENIRSLNVFTNTRISIPIYLSMRNPNEINVPNLRGKINRNITSVSGELTTLKNGHVTVKPNGVVTVKKIKEHEEDKAQSNTKSEKRKIAAQPTHVPSKKRKNALGIKDTRKQTKQPQPLKRLNAKKHLNKNDQLESINGTVGRLAKRGIKKKTKLKKTID